MSKFISLLKVSVKGIIRGKENKKKKLLSHGLILLIAGALITYYSYKFAKVSFTGLTALNAKYILLPEFFAISSIFLIITNYKKINDLFFKNTDYDLLESMPIKRIYIVLSKMIELYLSALLITLVFMLPAYYVYITNVNVGSLFHVYYFLTLLFVPCIPVVIATIIGYLMSFISSFFKRKDLVQLITGIGVFILAYYIGKSSINFSAVQIGNFGKTILDFFESYYPVTVLYREILIENNIISLIIYFLINTVSFAAITLIITRTYTFINSKLHQVSSNRNKKIKETKKLSKTRALLKKDFKKLVSSSNYLLNTCVGIIVLVLAVGGLITSTNIGIVTISEIGSGFGKIIFVYCLSMFLGYIYPTAMSLSLEGKNFYILRILPITFKTIIKEKNIFHLILSLPVTVATILVLIFKLNIKIDFAIPLFLLYIVMTLFYSNIHLLLDILFLNISWENEIKVIKRSIQSILSLVIAIVLGILPLIIEIDKVFKLYIYVAALFIITIAVFIVLNNYGTKKFNKTLN